MGDPERPDGLRHVPRRLQHLRDDARGKGEADPLAQPSRDRRRLALRQGPLRVLARRTRATASPSRAAAAARRRSTPVSWDEALDEAEAAAARTPARTSSRRSRAPRRWSRRTRSRGCCARARRALGGHARGRELARCSTASAGRSRRFATREVIVVLGDEPVAERAPIVDLWLRAARRNGAEILYELDEEKVRGAERAILIWSGPDGETRARGARASGSASGPPSTCRARRTRAASARRGPPPRTRRSPRRPIPIKLLVISGDEALANPDVRALAEQAEHVLAFAMFERPGARPRRPAAPGDELPRARGDVRQPRGPPAAASPRRACRRRRTSSRGSRSSASASASTSRRTRRRRSRSCRR